MRVQQRHKLIEDFFFNKRDTYQHTLSHLQHNLFYRCNRTILSCLNSLHLNGSCGREVHVPGINHQENTHLCLQVWRKKGYRLHCTHNYSKILPNSKRKTAGVLFECLSMDMYYSMTKQALRFICRVQEGNLDSSIEKHQYTTVPRKTTHTYPHM